MEAELAGRYQVPVVSANKVCTHIGSARIHENAIRMERLQHTVEIARIVAIGVPVEYVPDRDVVLEPSQSHL